MLLPLFVGRDRSVRALEEAAALKAPMLVLVCGADHGQSLEDSRDQIRDGIAALLPRAEELGIKLGVEPLHPMYAVLSLHQIAD